MRVHRGINKKTGKLKKGYRYSGRRLASGRAEIVKAMSGGGPKKNFAHGVDSKELLDGKKKLKKKKKKKVYRNLCPGCGYDMGTNWGSQYCSRSCMYASM